MENREQQILSEIKSMMASIRLQLEQLDAKMAELQQSVDPEGIEAEPIDIALDETVAPEVVAEPVEQSIDFVDDLPVVETPVVETPVGETPVVETPVVETPVVESPAVEEDDDDLPFFTEPEQVTVHAAANTVVRPVVIDAMTARQAWRTDMPGAPVKDIRSAISLNDRVIFINYLFNEDPMAFQEALTKINQMESLGQVVEFALTSHPEWDMDSEVVYRFMMAVRRRVK